MSKLTLRYQHDPSFFDPSLPRDDFGRLSVAVETERVSCKGGYWVQWQDVRGFSEALDVFPIVEAQPVVVQWGIDAQQGDDLILRLEIAAANKRGDLIVRFEVSEDSDPVTRGRGSFLTNYPDVDAFRLGIERLMNGEAREAYLVGQ